MSVFLYWLVYICVVTSVVSNEAVFVFAVVKKTRILFVAVVCNNVNV